MRAVAELPGTCRFDSGAGTTVVDLRRPPVSTPTGRLLAGRYRIHSLLGRGGMARVWLGQDEVLNRPVAVKQNVVDVGAGDDAHRWVHARALLEARATTRVNHDGVVRILDFVSEDGRPWIVMEALSGRTLADALATAGRLSTDAVARLGLRLLDVLAAVHRAGVVHRDVKPGNVHLGDDGRVVLIDFGIASIAGDGLSTTLDMFAGSPAYISPEMILGDRSTPASDLFSLGATLFAAAEGKPPFENGDLVTTLLTVLNDAPAPFVHSGRLRPLLQRLLAKEPAQRPGIARTRAALAAVLARPT